MTFNLEWFLGMNIDRKFTGSEGAIYDKMVELQKDKVLEVFRDGEHVRFRRSDKYKFSKLFAQTMMDV